MRDAPACDRFPAGPRRDPAEVARRLEAGAGRRVSLVFHRNRVNMASVRPQVGGGGVRVRLHEGYLGAPDGVLAALAAYLRTGRASAWREVAAFARGLPSPGAPPRAVALRTLGRHHDLEAVRDEVNRLHFGGRAACRITWGERGRRRARGGGRSIQFGSYCRDRRLVRVHPALDDPRVPGAFVAYIVFHELLHAEVPCGAAGGRLLHHPPEFRRREAGYPGVGAMRRLARDLLHVL